MGFIAVLVAAAASYGFGAAWYMALAKPWMAAAGLSEEEVQQSDPTPYIIAGVCAVVVAGMMRHIFAMAGITTFGNGLISGFGLGLFIATPWIVTNTAFGNRPRNLALIDGGYATFGCTIMGAILGIFG